jgi:two-component system CheB/CheR fusion protein
VGLDKQSRNMEASVSTEQEEIKMLKAKLAHAEQKANDLQNVFENILESTLAGYWDWDIPKGTKYLSPSLKSMFGYQDHEIENTPEAWQRIIHPDDLPGVMEVFDKHVQTQGIFPYDNEVRYYHKDGSIVWVYCRGKVIEWDKNNQPVRMVGCHINITALKRAEEKMKSMKNDLLVSMERFRVAQTAAKIGVWDWNVMDNTLELDEVMYDLYGIPSTERNDAFKCWQMGVHSEDLERCNNEVELALLGVTDFDSEFRIIWPDKSLHWIKAVARVQRDEDGNPLRMIGTTWDITKEKVNRDRNLQSMQKLEAKNQELQQFAYIASHDLQEPLRTITSMNDIIIKMYSKDLDDEAKKMMGFVSQAGIRMRNLVRGLLDYSRLGKNQTVEYIDCNKLLQEVQDDLSVAIENKGALIKVNKLPKLMGFKTELRLLFENLINNAMKFQKEGEIPKIKVSCSSDLNRWKFAIKDNGIGIPEEYKEKIFVIFQRLHDKNTYEGTGLGLAHCKKIVELHNGNMWVESILDEGSTFYFEIAKNLENAQT